MNKKIGDLITRIKEETYIEDEKEYKRVTIRMYHKGVCLRDIEKGSNIGTKRQFLVRPGQFIMSRIDARNGAFGIVPEDLDGAIVTNDFLTFAVNQELISTDYFKILSQSQSFLDFCISGSIGTTNRKRLKEDLFLSFEVELPDLQEQSKIIKKNNYYSQKNKLLRKEFSYQYSLMDILRCTILTQAIRGRLVAQDPNDEPAIKLLVQVEEEKKRQINEGNIKKEKPLPEIKKEEIPFELPKGWEWVRLPQIGELARGKSKHRPRNDEILYKDGTYPFVQTGDVARSNGLITSFSSLYNDIGLKQSRLWPKDTLCITIAANIADTGILTFDSCFPDSVVGFIPFSPIPTAKYFYYFFQVSKKNLIKYAPSTAQKNINLDILSNLYIPLPPLNEMIRIINKVESLMEMCKELEINIEKSKNDSEMLMKSILQESFNM